jgi:hypothetical protein
MPALLLKNPLASGLGILLLLISIALGVQTLRLALEQSALAKEQLVFSDFKKDLAEKSLKVVQDAAAKSAEQVDKLTAEVRSIGAIGTQTKTEIRYVQSNGGPCVADPAWRATVGGVQRILDGGGPGGNQGKTGSGATPVVRGAGATGSK